MGGWIEFEEFFCFLLAWEEQFEVTDDEWTLYFCEQQYGALAYDSSFDLERQYLRAMLMESLAVLGVIDIAYAQPHGLWPEFDKMWGPMNWVLSCPLFYKHTHTRQRETLQDEKFFL